MSWQELPNAPAPGSRICALEEVADGTAAMFNLGTEAPAFPLLVLRSGDEVFGYLNRCTHLGLPLAKQPQHLYFEAHEHVLCNVHYARYGWRDGRCISGECAGESLIAVPLAVIDGQVILQP